MIDIETTPIYFAEEILGLRLYDWQAEVLTWFEGATGKRVKGTLCTPNGAGKDSVVIASLALWWVSIHRRGRVVITSKDARQIDEQTEPAMTRHREKFPDWKFIEREISTPTGGKILLFTTDDEKRCEGFHRETSVDGKPSNEGPLLLIANEAKSINEGIFTAFDRCTYDGLLYASSPGGMAGRFYESHFNDNMGFRRRRVGLKDCPHVPQERIDDIRATYGADSAFARSTLDGEFVEAEGEARFDIDGLKYLSEQCDAEDAEPSAVVGSITEQDEISGINARAPVSFVPDEAGWVWMREKPEVGCRYIGFGDPMTGEQSEGSKDRDMHAFGVIRASYITDGPLGAKIERDAEVVAVLHAPGGARWHNDVLAARFSLLLRLYGDPLAIVESNNSGMEVMRMLMTSGRKLWRREKPNHRIPGKKMLDVVGFQTTAASKNLWIGALSQHISQRLLVCRYRLAVSQMQTFILDENGRGEAQQGCKDDFITGVGLGLFAISGATMMATPTMRTYGDYGDSSTFTANGGMFS